MVLLSDHGWHLGEKQRWAKRTLWSDGPRVPLIVAAPGYEEGRSSERHVGLIAIFPMLLELTGQPPRPDLEGRSLVPLLKDSDAPWDRPILTTFAPENHSLRSTRWNYIRYADGSEELYDRSDPHEWHDLAGPLEARRRDLADAAVAAEAERRACRRRLAELGGRGLARG